MIKKIFLTTLLGLLTNFIAQAGEYQFEISFSTNGCVNSYTGSYKYDQSRDINFTKDSGIVINKTIVTDLNKLNFIFDIKVIPFSYCYNKSVVYFNPNIQVDLSEKCGRQDYIKGEYKSGGLTLYFTIKFYKIDFGAFELTSNKNICGDNPLILTDKTNSQSDYLWEIRSGEDLLWYEIGKTIGNTLQIKPSEINDKALKEEGKPLFKTPYYFRYTNEKCRILFNKGSNIISHTFYQQAPSNATVSTSPPTCNGGADAQITISDLKYPDGSPVPIADKITYTLFNPDTTRVYNVQINGGVVTFNNILEGEELVEDPNNKGNYISQKNPQRNNLKLKPGTWKAILQDMEAQCSTPNESIMTFTVPDKPLLQTVKAFAGVPPVSNNTENYNILCSSAAHGDLQASAKGGTGPYKFTVLYPDGQSVTQETSRTSIYVNRLKEGQYTIKVSDYCTSIGVGGELTYPTVTLKAPPKLEVFPEIKDIPCKGLNNGEIIGIGNGGKAPYSYSINNKQSWQSSAFKNLIPGSYDVIVKDVFGCEASASAAITEPLQALGLASSLNRQEPLCNGSVGGVSIKATGGTIFNANSPYKYFITGRSDTIYATEATFSNLFAGNHTINIKDKNGCLHTQAFTLNQPGLISVTSDSLIPVVCNSDKNGKAVVSIKGGTAPYHVEWFNSNENLLKEETATNTKAISLAALAGGSYKIYLKDKNGCSNSSAAKLTFPFVIPFPEKLQLSIQKNTSISCFGMKDGSIQLSAIGGWNPLSYQYRLGTSAFSKTTIYANLAAGRYEFEVKDEKGCVKDTTVEILQPSDSLQIEKIMPSMVGCKGESSGSVFIAMKGGWGKYRTSLDNGKTWQDTTLVTQLSSGKYTLLISDNGNCRKTSRVEITEPKEFLTIKLDSIINSSCSKANGSIFSKVNGGTPGYNYIWKSGKQDSLSMNTSTITDITVGVYNLKVKDKNNCSAELKNIVVSDLEAPKAEVTTLKPVSCPGYADGEASINIVSGVRPVKIIWPDGTESSSAKGLSKDSMLVTLTDARGCTGYFPLSVPGPSPFQMESSIKQPNCYGYCDGKINIDIIGGTRPFKYSWMGRPAMDSTIIEGVCAGNYYLSLTDRRGCIYKDSVQVPETPPIQIEAGDSAVLCTGQTLKTAVTEMSGIFEWKFNDNFYSDFREVVLKDSGTYTVRVISFNNCIEHDTIRVITSDKLLKADFLMASNSIVGDTVVIFEISKPLPSSIEWSISDSVTRYQSWGDVEQLIFPEEGVYTIKLKAELGECKDEISKQIYIYSPDGDVEDNARWQAKDYGIKSFIVYPNPNSGVFSVKIALFKAEAVSLKFVNLLGNHTIAEKADEGKESYLFYFNHPGINQGVYVLNLKVGSEIKSVSVLVE